jgi:putative ABC transport system permease protein
MFAPRSSRAWESGLTFSFFFLKELRKFPFFFFLLFMTLLLGTMGLIGISVVSFQVQEKLEANANQLLTSDMAVSARRPLFAQEERDLKKIMTSFETLSYQVIDLYSMITVVESGSSRLAEVRGAGSGFPFYGVLRPSEGNFDPEKLYISRDLAEIWKIGKGDELQVGTIRMKITDVITQDTSSGLRGISLAPRIYFPLSQLPLTGLLRPGATGSFAWHFRLKDPAQVVDAKARIYEALKDPAVKITVPQESSEQTGRVINLLTNFMGLSALIGLILSLVGIFYLYQSHLITRLRDFCLLNLNGLSKGYIIAGVVSQFSLVFVLVMMTELIILAPLYDLARPFLSGNIGLDLGEKLNLLWAIREIPFLFLLSLFILVPLLAGLMRTEMGLQLKAQKLSMGRFRFFDFIPFAMLLWLFSCYIAHSFKTGNIFFLSLLLVFLVSTLVVKLGQWVIRKLIARRGLLLPSIENGIALRNLTRSGHKLTLSFLSLAMGATLISLILQLDKMIISEFAVDSKKPSLFVFDIQEEQMEPLVELARKNQSPLAFVTPMIRARLEKVNGKKFVRDKKAYDFRSREEDEDARFRNNSINLTYRGYLTDAEKIIEGEPFPSGGAPETRPAWVSIEKRWSQRMNVDLGDKLTFDIQGVEFEGVVRNIKEVKWTTFYPNFFVTIEPGIIDAAPKTYLAILPSSSQEAKLSFQRLALEEFPNISFIDVGELVTKLSGLFEKSRQAIEVISWLSLAVGLVILYGLSHDQVYRRYYDLALLKSLGFSSTRLRLNLLYEFGTLFFGAMSLGLFLGWLIAQLIGREVFKLPLSVDWLRLLYPALLLSVLCLATILVSSWRAVKARPRELLSDS